MNLCQDVEKSYGSENFFRCFPKIEMLRILGGVLFVGFTYPDSARMKSVALMTTPFKAFAQLVGLASVTIISFVLCLF